MSDNLFVAIIAFELALYFFLHYWQKEIIIVLHFIHIGVYTVGAFILLISTFGKYRTLIRYKIPFGDNTIYTIKIGFR